MYRILIVDDEPLVRRGIRNSVNWNELGFEMVAEAADGVEALSEVLENVPDIILLDINMPRMDGLEFASIIKKQYPNVRIVIITGYNDFEFIQSALRTGVDDYILKPITKEDVNNIIQAQLHLLEEEKTLESEQLEEESIVNIRRKKQDMLNAILKKNPAINQPADTFFKLIEWEPFTNVYLVLLQEYLSECDIWSDGQSDSLAEFAILNISQEVLEEYDSGFAFLTYKNEMALLMRGKKEDVSDILSVISRNIMDFLEIPVDFAVSGKKELHNLSDLYEQATHSLHCSFVLSDKNVLFYEDVEQMQEEDFSYPEKIEIEILDKMFTGKHKECAVLIDQFFDKLAKATPKENKVKNMLLRLLIKMQNTIESVALHTDKKASDDMPVLFDPMTQVESFDRLEDARRWVQDMYKKAYDYVNSVKSRTGQLFIKIRAYIENNYSDSELNLKKCSDDLYLSPNYISRIIKKETGKTFVEYLHEYRISKAEELLAQPGSMVYKVSGQTGFTHPSYFSSVFKKVTGQSPKQYKESL